MSKMHSRARGRSGSLRPEVQSVPSWTRYKEKEVELLITKLAKEGRRPSQIGLHLRDTYGIPSVKVATKKSIAQILREHNAMTKLPEDILALIKKQVAIDKHMKLNKHDMTAKRGSQLTISKINRLAKYYKSTGVLPADWNYNPEKVITYLE